MAEDSYLQRYHPPTLCNVLEDRIFSNASMRT